MRMPDPMPFGETFFEASVRAIVAALLVNKPRGGCVESVVTFATHRFFFPVDIGKVHRFCVRLSCVSRGERAEVLALASFGVFIARVQTILARFQFPNHKRILPVCIFLARPLACLSRPVSRLTGLDSGFATRRRSPLLCRRPGMLRQRSMRGRAMAFLL